MCCHARNTFRIFAQVLKLNPRLASLDILCVGPRPLDTAFSAIIRRAPHALACHTLLAAQCAQKGSHGPQVSMQQMARLLRGKLVLYLPAAAKVIPSRLS